MKHRIFAAVLAAAMLTTLAACGKTETPKPTETPLPPPAVQTAAPEAVKPSTEPTPAPSAKPETPVSTPSSTPAAAKDSWKAEFEKSLYDNYGKTPVKYEDLGNGIYQVYVELDGNVIPFVTVDSATGDYHG